MGHPTFFQTVGCNCSCFSGERNCRCIDPGSQRSLLCLSPSACLCLSVSVSVRVWVVVLSMKVIHMRIIAHARSEARLDLLEPDIFRPRVVVHGPVRLPFRREWTRGKPQPRRRQLQKWRRKWAMVLSSISTSSSIQGLRTCSGNPCL